MVLGEFFTFGTYIGLIEMNLKASNASRNNLTHQPESNRLHFMNPPIRESFYTKTPKTLSLILPRQKASLKLKNENQTPREKNDNVIANRFT